MELPVERTAIGVDLGGTKMLAAIVSDNGKVKKKLHYLTDTNGLAAVERQIIDAVGELSRFESSPPIGLGIGVAGQVAVKTGLVRFAPNLDWHDAPLQEDLSRALDMRVTVTNDVRAATMGEWIFGSGKECLDLACIFVGTGIGGGIVSAGRLLTGHANTAGEIGHMTIELHGPVCSCGNQGCLEALAGGWAIARQARQIAASNPQTAAALLKAAGNKLSDITAKAVSKAYHAHDPLASSIVDGVAEALVAGAASIVNMFNPQRIILGGGIIEGFPELIGLLDSGIRQRALSAAVESLEITSAELGNMAGVIGAAAMVLRAPGIGE